MPSPIFRVITKIIKVHKDDIYSVFLLRKRAHSLVPLAVHQVGHLMEVINMRRLPFLACQEGMRWLRGEMRSLCLAAPS